MKKKQFTIKYIPVGTPEQSATIVKKLVRVELQKIYRQHGVIAVNLDEVLDKYITAVPADEVINRQATLPLLNCYSLLYEN